jgi:hypothetical protein
MGYESKYYIVSKSKNNITDHDGKLYAHVIAMFDMCKFVELANFFTKETDCYIYSDDGNTPILKDGYDDSLKELSIKEALKALLKVEEGNEQYRRIMPFKALLTVLDKDRNNWDNLFVLHYGY